ncbi:hypothetical protein BGX38DRAFT_618843 [Terfezia claveryi]|nr:hypothetical protein BGX38DRAFT_618843 [Terfezia claveryi]
MYLCHYAISCPCLLTAAKWKEVRKRIRVEVEKGYDYWMMHIPLNIPPPELDRWSFGRVDWLDVHEDKATMPWGATRTSGYLGGQDVDITGRACLTGGSPFTSAEDMALMDSVGEAYGSKGSFGYEGSVESKASTSGIKDSIYTDNWEKKKKKVEKYWSQVKGKDKESFADTTPLASSGSTASSASASPASLVFARPDTLPQLTPPPPTRGSVGILLIHEWAILSGKPHDSWEGWSTQEYCPARECKNEIPSEARSMGWSR